MVSDGHREIIAERTQLDGAPPARTARQPSDAAGSGLRESAQRREKVTLTVADVSCSPGTIGVAESAACAPAR